MKPILAALMLLSGAVNAFADHDSLAARGAAAFAAKNWLEAAAIYKQLVAADPTNWNRQQKLVSAEVSAGHYADALASCDLAIAYAHKAIGGMPPPKAARARVALGKLVMTRGTIVLELNGTLKRQSKP